jgi:DNA-binding beta-propeller fold protein YncE
MITTVGGKGSGNYGFSGDGGPAANALLNDPQGAAVDSAGNIYITDQDNQRIRMISPSRIISTIAGDGKQGFLGDGGPSASARNRSAWRNRGGADRRRLFRGCGK